MNIKKRFSIVALIMLSFFILIVNELPGAYHLTPPVHAETDAQPQKSKDNLSTAGPVILTDQQEKYPLGLHLEILEDPGGKLTIEDVSSPALNSKFIPSNMPVPNYGYTNSVYWVRFHLDNQTTQTNEWLLELGFVYLQYVDLYSPAPGSSGFTVKQTGALRPVSTRDIPFPRIVFSLTVPTQTQQTYYLRFQNEGSMTLPLTLWSKDTFWVQSQPTQMRDWLFIGALLALLVYHLFLYFSLRDLRYLFFVLLLAGMFAHLSTLAGYLQVYVFPSLYQVKQYGVWFPTFAYASVVLFADAFWELRTRHRILHKLHIGILVGWVAIFILGALTTYHNTVRMLVPYALFSLVLTWIPWVVSWRKSFAPSRFFVIAWLGMLISLFLVLVVRLRILPSLPITEQLYQPGILIMAVGWSMAMADRINWLKAETDQANQNLRQSEHELAQILEGVPIGVVVYGKDQKKKYINQRAVTILSHPTQDNRADGEFEHTSAKAIDDFSFSVAGTNQKYPSDQIPIYAALKGQSASADDLEADLVDKKVPIEMWASPIMDEVGNVVSAVAAFQDITQRKQAEEALAAYARNLERSNRDLQEFAFVASHDLQEPLRKIETFSSLLLEAQDNLNDQQRDLLARMQNSANRMRSMVDGLLQLSRLETHAQPFQPVDLNQAIKEVISDLEAQIRRTGGTIEVCELPVIEADPRQMRRLFQNLIGNALKFQPPGGNPWVKVCPEQAGYPGVDKNSCGG